MAIDWKTLPEKNIDNGMDQNSAENQIEAGYAEFLENIDTTKKGVLSKRTGYEGVGGWIPFRVTKVVRELNKLCFELDQAVEFKAVRGSPIVVAGNSSLYSGARWYETFSADPAKTVDTGNNLQTFNIASAEHGLTPSSSGTYTYPYFIDVFEKTNPEELSSNYVFVDRKASDDSTEPEIEVQIQQRDVPTDYYFAYEAKAPELTKVHWSIINGFPANGKINIPASSHQIQSTSLGVRVFEYYFALDDQWIEISENTQIVLLSSENNRDVEIVLETNSVLPSPRFAVCIYEIPEENAVTGTIAQGATVDISFSLTETPFIRPHIYVEEGNQYVRVLPQEVQLDAENNIGSVTFVNTTNQDTTFRVLYEYLSVRTNTICVETSSSTNAVDDVPEICIWGLPHKNNYTSSSPRPGWVNNLSVYTQEENSEIIAALGGNFFRETKYEDGPGPFLLGEAYVRLSSRLDSTHRIGPRFTGTYQQHQRTSNGGAGTAGGTIAFQGGDSYWAEVVSVISNGTNEVTYKLSVPGVTLIDTVDLPIFPGDFLTVRGCGYKRNDGTFKVIQGSLNLTTEELSIRVERSDASPFLWEELESGGKAGIFTDYLYLRATAEALPGDTITSADIPEEQKLTVTNTNNVVVQVENCNVPIYLPAGQYLKTQRTSDVLPLRTGLLAPTVSTFVNGDMLQLDDLNRTLRIKNIVTLPNTLVTITGNEEEGNVRVIFPLGTPITNFKTGDRFILVDAERYSGTHTVTNIIQASTDTTTGVVEIAAVIENGLPDPATSINSILVGNTITVDESLPISDDSDNSEGFIKTTSRWTPIEAPLSSQGLLADQRYTKHQNNAEYANAEFTSSAAVNENLYFTNRQNNILKYDGQDIHEAGFPWWEPAIFVYPKMSAAGNLGKDSGVAGTGSDSTSSPLNGVLDYFQFTIDSTEFDGAVGETWGAWDASKIRFVFEILSIEKNDTDATTTIVGDPIRGNTSRNTIKTETGNYASITTIYPSRTYNYYTRLDYTDINGNRSFGNATEFQVTSWGPTNMYIHVSAPPLFANFDYDRVRLNLYREVSFAESGEATAIYRNVSRTRVLFEENNSYIRLVDGISDAVLANQEADNNMAAVYGRELGLTAQRPWPAKYVQARNSRLLLANVQEPPRWEVDIFDTTTRSINTLQVLNPYFNTSTFIEKDIYYTENTDIVNPTSGSISSSQGIWTVNVLGVIPPNYTEPSWVFIKPRFVSSYVFDYENLHLLDNAQDIAVGWYKVNYGVNFYTINVGTVPPPSEQVQLIFAFDNRHIPVTYINDFSKVTEFLSQNIAENLTALSTQEMVRAINGTSFILSQFSDANEGKRPVLFAHAPSFRSTQFFIETTGSLPSLRLSLGGTSSEGEIYINNQKVSPGQFTKARSKPYSSRLLVSANSQYPEIFDNLTTTNPDETLSWVDINPADGQSITGLASFYGDSTFSDSAKGGSVVIFKEHSIYVYNIDKGLVDQLDTQGLGCTYPRSIAPSKRGIFFANNAGIYRLLPNTQIEYISPLIERYWETNVSPIGDAIAVGFSDATRQTYVLNHPVRNETENKQALVYAYNKEKPTGIGAWSLFSNYPATAWNFVGVSSYFGDTAGNVFKLRDTKTVTDYRDDDAPIYAEIKLRPLHFGDSSRRKYLSSLFVHLRTIAPAQGTKVFIATDLSNNFKELDAFELDNKSLLNGIEDSGQPKVISLRFSTNKSKFQYLQNKIVNDIKDEGLELTMLEYRLAGLSSGGTTEAARTTRK